MSVIKAYILPHPPLIIPAVGRGEERKIQKTIGSFKQVSAEIAALEPETVVIASPHSAMYADFIHISPGSSASGNFAQFQAGEVAVTVDYDVVFAETLTENVRAAGIPAGMAGERNPQLDHATLIPLWFLKNAWQPNKPFPKVVRTGLAGLSPATHYAFGRQIAATAENLNRKVVMIASGDLSHRLKSDGPYGFVKEGPLFDAAVTGIIQKGDFGKLLNLPPDLCDKAGECGYRSLLILAGALDGKAIDPKLLSYEGPFGVGYAVGTFTITGEDPARRFLVKAAAESAADPYVQLATNSLSHFLRTGNYLPRPDDLPEEMTQRRAGAFVTLKKGGELRGCIGTIEPVTASLADEIIRNAVSSGTQDPRFPPVSPSELKDLTVSVDVLSPPERIDSIDQLDVKRYGVIVSSGYRRGLLLPNIEGVETVKAQVEIARRKAGISSHEAVQLERFEVVRHE